MQLTKMVMRKDAVEALENRREEDIKEFVDSIMDEEVQKAIGLQVEKLHKKSKLCPVRAWGSSVKLSDGVGDVFPLC